MFVVDPVFRTDYQSLQHFVLHRGISPVDDVHDCAYVEWFILLETPMHIPPYDPNFVYDPTHPMNVADRANDPDDGIDYDDILLTTEADFRARRGLRFRTIDEFGVWLHAISERVVVRHQTERRRAAS
jgi:hypothetical protein